ncbi:unnamed protein product [Brugia timori]|uniref:Rho-GAP domain-containing protein n=1 Tax=Brugia timori TaxID=42155 RepID=A0A3P7XMZ4_9BILA|nr:unnamed protein product [Brugia timori]
MLLRVIDCLPVPNKNTLIQIMDHLKLVMSSEQHNGITAARLTGIFGCLLFCSCNAPTESGSTQGGSSIYPPKMVVNPLDTDQAARTLRLLVDIWPSRINGSDSSSSGSASNSTDVTNTINPDVVMIKNARRRREWGIISKVIDNYVYKLFDVDNK